MHALLDAQGLDKGFARTDGRVDVLRDCSVSLAAGESLAVMGSSGSGKSTLLNLLTGLDRPDAGSVTWRGEDLLAMSGDRLSRWRRDELGFVFQFHFLMPDLTAEENLLVPARLRGPIGPDERDRAADLLGRMGLADRSGHLPGELSGGEQQRVAMARAFVNAPSLVMADEPTGNLDRARGAELADMLFGWAADHGSALVVVTHDPDLAARADRTLVLRDGALHPDPEAAS